MIMHTYEDDDHQEDDDDWPPLFFEAPGPPKSRLAGPPRVGTDTASAPPPHVSLFPFCFE